MVIYFGNDFINHFGLRLLPKTLIDKKQYPIEQLCYSMQETVFAMLVEVTERAMAHCDKSEVVLGGGVACNARLQEMCSLMAKDRGATSAAPEREFLVDNPAMIAWTGLLRYRQGHTLRVEESVIKPYERTDEVDLEEKSRI